MRSRLAAVSAIAVGLAIAVPLHAQEAPATTEGDTAAVRDATMERQRLTSEDLRVVVDEMEVGDFEPFAGSLVNVRGEIDIPIFMLFTDGDFELGGQQDITQQDEDPELLNALAQAGFRDVQADFNRAVFQGRINDHEVFALGLHEHADAAYFGVATAQATPVAEFDLDALRESAGEAGFEAIEELEARLFHAQLGDDRAMAILVAPQDFAAGEAVEIDADDLRQRMEDAGLQEVEEAEEGFRFFRGEHDDRRFVAILGPLDNPQGVTD